jgi:hypothetical protein
MCNVTSSMWNLHPLTVSPSHGSFLYPLTPRHRRHDARVTLTGRALLRPVNMAASAIGPETDDGAKTKRGAREGIGVSLPQYSLWLLGRPRQPQGHR